jgi:hypothetical protein
MMGCFPEQSDGTPTWVDTALSEKHKKQLTASRHTGNIACLTVEDTKGALQPLASKRDSRALPGARSGRVPHRCFRARRDGEKALPSISEESHS